MVATLLGKSGDNVHREGCCRRGFRKSYRNNRSCYQQTNMASKSTEHKTHPTTPAPRADFGTVSALSVEMLDELVANPNWAQIDGPLHDLLMQLPKTSFEIERTTILTWMYQNTGVITFEELVEMIQKGEVRQRKKNLRQVLRNLEDLKLIHVINFPDPQRGVTIEDNEGVVGRNSMFELTWLGMVWLRRAWMARKNLMRSCSYEYAHRVTTEEEDEGKKNSPAWVENISMPGTNSMPEIRLGMRSVFDMASEINSTQKR